jgi:hypothetical protein
LRQHDQKGPHWHSTKRRLLVSKMPTFMTRLRTRQTS